MVRNEDNGTADLFNSSNPERHA
ncbi:hypothetical protein JL09_g6393 [Pichia kudriavzevii]|uniref:Uncharacterized protein n=1 Tax=Pichia kudriavzevii TaxID=4909 RepID=A0A099NQX9_PICKU|nr:hypothetical protein JL09_g6394 [Pichia kudriavzevii]KGK34460.1 hypothetical protein JL09_g6393 [Pichia kudriavzevii]